MMGRGKFRTSRTGLLIRGWLIFTIPVWIPAGLLFGFYNAFWPIAAIAFVLWFGVSIFMGMLCWILTKWWIMTCPSDHDFQQFVRSGGSVWWDMICPYPFNPDCTAVRMGGLPEPKTKWVPPPSYMFQCPFCGVRIEQQFCFCWNCYAMLTPSENVVGNVRTYVDVQAPRDEVECPTKRIGWGGASPHKPKKHNKKPRSSDGSDTIYM